MALTHFFRKGIYERQAESFFPADALPIAGAMSRRSAPQSLSV